MFPVFNSFYILDSPWNPLEIYFMNAEFLCFPPATAVTTKSKPFQTRAIFGFGLSPILVTYTNRDNSALFSSNSFLCYEEEILTSEAN